MKQPDKSKRPASRRGSSIIYGLFCMTSLIGFTGLAVDLGRAQLAKTQLQATVDNAARYAVVALEEMSPDNYWSALDEVHRRVREGLRDNRIDGRRVRSPLRDDLDFGIWDASTRTFTPVTGAGRINANAIRLNVAMGDQNNEGVEMYFGGLIGLDRMTVTASSIAMLQDTQRNVPFSPRNNMWLAGMPNGSWLSDPWGGEGAPNHAPNQVNQVDIYGGGRYQFTAHGTASWWDNGNDSTPPEGQLHNIYRQAPYHGNTNGMSDVITPGGALIGVFLSDTSPTVGPVPSTRDYSQPGALEQTQSEPALKQVFYIGNGFTPSGAPRTIVAPPGAKRLFIARADSLNRDNAGWFEVTVTNLDRAKLVQ